MAASTQQPIDLYYWPTPNGWKITIMLEECGLPYAIHPINIGKGDQFGLCFICHLVPRTRNRYKVRQVGNDGGVAPLHNGKHGVGARDEVELDVIRIMRTQLPQRVDRIGIAWAVDFHRAHIEEGVGSAGKLAHLEAHVGVGNLQIALERLHTRGDENHRIEPKGNARLLGAGKVADVYRVEGAAHNAQAHFAGRVVETQVVEPFAYHRHTNFTFFPLAPARPWHRLCFGARLALAHSA